MVGLPPPPAGGHAGPQGHYAYGAHTPLRPFRRFGALATAATVSLGVMAVVALFGLGTHLNRVGLVEREFREGGGASTSWRTPTPWSAAPPSSTASG